MNRINVYEVLGADPRFNGLIMKIPKHMAYGALICLWDLGMIYWKNKDAPLNIPADMAKYLPNISELLEFGFVRIEADGSYYCCGAKDRWGHLRQISEQARKAGLASAEARKAKSGSAIPSNASNAKPAETERRRTAAERKRTQPKDSGSISSSGSSTDSTSNPLGGQQNAGTLIAFYCDTWKRRYNSAQNPVIRPQDAKSMKQLIESVGYERANKLVDAFLRMPEKYMIQRRHEIAVLMTSLNAVTAFMSNGKVVTSTQLKDVEKKTDQVQGTDPNTKGLSDFMAKIKSDEQAKLEGPK